MQLNVSTCYAMQIILYLTRNKKVVSSTELAESLKISQRYIVHIAGKLREGGLINSNPGMSGGYTINQEKSPFSVFDVVTLMEGEISIPECIARLPGCGEPCKPANLHDALNVLKDYADTYFQTVTFDKLADMNSSGHLSDVIRLVETHVAAMKEQT